MGSGQNSLPNLGPSQNPLGNLPLILKEYKFEALILAKVAIVALLNSVMLKFQPLKMTKRGLFDCLKTLKIMKNQIYMFKIVLIFSLPQIFRVKALILARLDLQK